MDTTSEHSPQGKIVFNLLTCRSLRIGTWHRTDRDTAGLAIFYQPEKAYMTYYTNMGSIGYKMEYPFSFIKSIELQDLESSGSANEGQNQGQIVINLTQCPNFYTDSESGLFGQCDDFTEDQQASRVLVHRLCGPIGVLRSQLAKFNSFYKGPCLVDEPSRIFNPAPAKEIEPISTHPHNAEEKGHEGNNNSNHKHHLHIGLHHDHNHDLEKHHDHFHPHIPSHRHTVVHAVKSKHPPHHNTHTKARKFLVARPRARQYFTDDGDLHKQCDDGVPRQAGKFELFLDLLYIGLTANFAEDMIHHPTSTAHLGKYVLIFIPAWRIWSDLTNMMNMYYNDDIIQRVLIVWIMILMLLYGNNATFIDESLSAIRVTAGSFLVARFSLICVNLVYSLTVHQHALQLRYHNFISLAIIPLWAPVFLPPERISNNTKIAVSIVAFFADQFTNIAIHNPWFKRYFKLKYSTAVDIDHHIERMGAFYIIVLGEFLYGLVWASPAALDDLGGKFGRAAMSLIISFCLCWLYMSCDGSRENPETGIHALRWKFSNGFQWLLLHLPLSAALLITGDICAVFVKYGDDLAGIEENLGKRAESGAYVFPAKVDWQGLRWLFCGGLAIGLLCLYWISLLHHEADEDQDTKCIFFFRAWLRRIWRAPFAIIIACLPLVPPEKLTITSLLAICTTLLLFTLVWEMLGGMDSSWNYFEGGKDAFCQSENEVLGLEPKANGQSDVTVAEKLD